MSANVYDPPVTDLLLVVVFQLGIGLVLLAEAATGARGAASRITLLGQLLGSVTALGAVVILLVRWRVRNGT